MNIKNISKRFLSNMALLGAALVITGCATNDSYAGSGSVSIGLNVPLGNGVSSTITYGTGGVYYNNYGGYYRHNPPAVIYSTPPHYSYPYPYSHNRPIIINNGHPGYYDNRPIIIDNRNYNKYKSPRPHHIEPRHHDRRGVWR